MGPKTLPDAAQLTFQRETFSESLLSELLPLLRAHWREIAHYQDIPLDVDSEAYRALDAHGVLRIFTLRGPGEPMVNVEDGSLGAYGLGPVAGYAVFIVRANPHYRGSLQAVQDVLYLDPARRGRMAGARFIARCDGALKAEGVQAVYHHVKATFDFGPMLERMGYQLVDFIYARRLDREE